MKQTVMLLTTLTVLLAGTGYSAPVNKITVVDTRHGCLGDYEDESHELVLKDQTYRSGAISIPAKQVESLRESILNAPTNTIGLLESLGFTKEWFDKEKDNIPLAALPRHWKARIKKEPAFYAPIKDAIAYEVLSDYLLYEIACGDQVFTTDYTYFSLTLPGEPTLNIETVYLGKLPLIVRHGKRKWKIYSPEVSGMLQEFAKPEGPSYHWLDIRNQWSPDKWNPEYSSTGLRSRLDEILTREAYEKMPDFETIQSHFKITKADSGHINMEPLSMHLCIDVIDYAAIDKIWCWIHLSERGIPLHTWNDILKLYKAADQMASEHKWLRDWCAGGEDRQLELQISGLKAYTGKDIKRDASPAWRKAKLKGKPDIQIYLREGSGVRGDVYLGRKERKALVIHYKQGEGDHWLDKIDIPYGHTDFVVISSAGKYMTHSNNKTTIQTYPTQEHPSAAPPISTE